MANKSLYCIPIIIIGINPLTAQSVKDRAQFLLSLLDKYDSNIVESVCSAFIRDNQPLTRYRLINQ